MKTVYWLDNKKRSQCVLRSMTHRGAGLISRHCKQNHQGETLMMDKLIYRRFQSGIHLPFTALLLALAVFSISSSAAAADTEGQAQSASCKSLF